MAGPSCILFNKSLSECRSLGARGGRAYGRNLRARRALLPTPRAALLPCVLPQETTAKAIAVLEAQFFRACRPAHIVESAPRGAGTGNEGAHPGACRTPVTRQDKPQPRRILSFIW